MIEREEVSARLPDVPSTASLSSAVTVLNPEMSHGIVVEGSIDRLLLALGRAAAGKGLTLVGMGGSMTADHGGMRIEMQEAHELAFPGTAQSCTRQCSRDGWLVDLFVYLAKENPKSPFLLKLVKYCHLNW